MMPGIFSLKELEVLDTPVLLFRCELPSGLVEYWATHAVTFEDADYLPRILNHTALETRTLSDDGIDTVNRVSVVLANADSHFSQIERSVGWKGARLTVEFVFFDLQSGEPTSAAEVLFRGVANPPDEITESTVRLSFTNRLNLQRMLMPPVRIQRRCPWAFPTSLEQREEAISGGVKGQYSPFYRCGYSAGLPGGCGSLDGGEAFTSCNGTRADCETRGMFSQDDQGRATRRFGGVEFLPSTIEVRSHGEKGTHLVSPVENKARYNDFVPLAYGTSWYEPPVVFARSDGNLTRIEVLLSMGEINGVLKVVVNNTEIPVAQANADMTATGWYKLVSPGRRPGEFNENFTDAQGAPLGDPYGSMAMLSVVVPNHVSNGGSLPRTQVLIEGLKLDRFGADGSYLDSLYTNNPAWVLLDMLRRCGWTTDEVELSSFASAAAHCDNPVAANDLYGNPASIPRYQANVVIRKRRSAADVVRGVRNCAGLYLTYGLGGKLELRVESSLAVQQPELPAGSNSTELLSGGWPAYEFGDGSDGKSGILRRPNGEAAIRLRSRTTADTPNRYSIEFQDQFNAFQQDSLSLVDMEDALSTGQEVSAELRALGIPNFNQASRILRRHLDKGIRGNCFVEFETSIRALGIKPGDIVTLTYLKEGLQRQPFRVVKIATGLNHATSTITCQLHDDAWYADGIIGGSSGYGRQQSGELGLPKPLTGTEWDAYGRPQFGITESASQRTDGSASVTLTVAFTTPGRPKISTIGTPLLSLTPDIGTTGGALPGGATWYYAIATLDVDGNEGELSFLVRASVPESTSTNSVRLEDLSFPSAATSFNVYRGVTPSALFRIATNATVASTFLDDGLPAELITPPDVNYDHARFYWRLERVPEHPVTLQSGSSIGSDALQMISEEHAGAVVRITSGAGAGQERAVLGNDAQTLTVSSPWAVEPDSTSQFVVAEDSWHFGAAAKSSPASFEVPNREGATVHVSGRSVNAHGRECAYEISPLTRWQIGGASSLTGDADVAGQPGFGFYTNGQGVAELVAVGFVDLANTRGVTAGTLSLQYWDELSGPAATALGTALAAGGTVVDLNMPGSAVLGSLIQIGPEILVVEEILNGGQRYEVTRGSHDTVPGSYPAGETVYHLRRKVVVIPFVSDFFGSPASGSYGYPIQLPDVRIGAAEFFVTNARGNSETRRLAFTGTLDYGLRTLSGGQLSVQVDGPLAIEDDAAPPLVVQASHAVRDVFAVVKEAPAGGTVDLRLMQDDDVFCDLTIPDGSGQSNVVGGLEVGYLREKSRLKLHVLGVPQGANTTPGAELSVIVRL